ncbi:MAG TPA: protein-disulfide reductase DsbD domain-containing protein [Chitinophagales bacterium]|nr:protein-disulfide reductase DsbD domain-containing protein [Chitinophagales bacterium]
MKKILTFLFLIAATPLLAQYVNPNVKWELASKEVGDHEFELKWTAKISPGYHLYSQFIGDGGPIPTSFTFTKSSGYQLEHKVKESGNKHEAVEPVFDNMKLIWFEDKGVFTQRVKLLKDEATVKGVINFMTCNDKMCDPPSDHQFEIKLEAKVSSPAQKDSTGKSSIPTKDSKGAATAISGNMDSGFNSKENVLFFQSYFLQSYFLKALSLISYI